MNHRDYFEIVILVFAGILWCSSLFIIEKYIIGIKILWPICASITCAAIGVVWPSVIHEFWSIEKLLQSSIIVCIVYVAFLILPYFVICFCFSYLANKQKLNFDIFVALPSYCPYIVSAGIVLRTIISNDIN